VYYNIIKTTPIKNSKINELLYLTGFEYTGTQQ
jgi:hypothetical protein